MRSPTESSVEVREAAERMVGARRYILPWAAGCVTCSQHMAGEMMPPHDPSLRCESGKRSHCTCDVCF